MTEHVESNRLPILAAEIRRAHADVQDAARTAAQRAIDAGHALIEAKDLVAHGGWLPWLREHCALAERTAQLYMKIAKSGNSAETVAALGLQAAASEMEIIFDPGYKIFYHCTEQGKQEWYLFILFLAQQCGWYPDGAAQHVEWLSQKQFFSPCDWLTGEGPAYRKQWRMNEPSPEFVEFWRAFLNTNQPLPTVEEVDREIEAIYKRVGPYPAQPVRRKRRRKSATLRISGEGRGGRMKDWTESERERQAAVLAGKSVVANVRKGADESLVAWAKAEGRYVYIGREDRFGRWPASTGTTRFISASTATGPGHCRLSRAPRAFAGIENAAAGIARQGARLLVSSAAVPRRRTLRGGQLIGRKRRIAYIHLVPASPRDKPVAVSAEEAAAAGDKNLNGFGDFDISENVNRWITNW